MTTGLGAILNDSFDIRKNGDAAKNASADVNLALSTLGVGRSPSANFDGRLGPNQIAANLKRRLDGTSTRCARHIGITREQQARKP
jgi:hypothetical protein